jgi:hypothetical protein
MGSNGEGLIRDAKRRRGGAFCVCGSRFFALGLPLVLLIMEIAVGAVVILLLPVAALFLLSAPFLLFAFFAAVAHGLSPNVQCKPGSL